MLAAIGKIGAIIAVFFGIMPLVMIAVYVTTDRIEWRPTAVSIESLEHEGFPESEYLHVIGGNVVFGRAEIKMQRNEVGDEELYFIVAPVVNDSVLKEWEGVTDWKGVTEEKRQVDASRVRLLVQFEAEQVARDWPEMKKQIDTGQSVTLRSVKMDLTGEIDLIRSMAYKPREFLKQTVNFDDSSARRLRSESHYYSPLLIVKSILTTICCFAIALVFSFFGDRRKPVLVGPLSRDFTHHLSLRNTIVDWLRRRKIPASGVCTFEFKTDSAGAVEIRLSSIAPTFVNREVQFHVDVEMRGLHYGGVEVVSYRRILFAKELRLSSSEESFNISLWDQGIYLYHGEHLKIQVYAAISFKDTLLVEQQIEVSSLAIETFNPACRSELKVPYTDERSFLSDTLSLLNSRAKLTIRPFPKSARKHRQVAVKELFKGRSKIDLVNARLRIVVSNVERYLSDVDTSNGFTQRNSIVRPAVVFEKEIPFISKDQPIESYLDDILSFNDLFGQHCPPIVISATDGIDFHLQVELIHPELSNVYTDGMHYGQFKFEDFFDPESKVSFAKTTC